MQEVCIKAQHTPQFPKWPGRCSDTGGKSATGVNLAGIIAGAFAFDLSRCILCFVFNCTGSCAIST